MPSTIARPVLLKICNLLPVVGVAFMLACSGDLPAPFAPAPKAVSDDDALVAVAGDSLYSGRINSLPWAGVSHRVRYNGLLHIFPALGGGVLQHFQDLYASPNHPNFTCACVTR